MMENLLIRDNVHLDANCNRWRIVRTSSIIKEDAKLRFSEKEIIESYKLALDCLYKAMDDSKVGGAVLMVLRSCDYTIPFLYICRHLLELSMKAYLESHNYKLTTGHYISRLWHEVKTVGEINIEKYDELINLCVMLDDDGVHLRYVKNKNGKEYSNKPLFIEYEKTYRTVSDLYEELIVKSGL